MGHDHPHPHPHEHGESSQELSPALDLSIPDEELSPADVGRRGFLRQAGVLGAGVAASAVGTGALVGTAAPAAAGGRTTSSRGGYRWLAGDHHVHTQYSNDGLYRVIDHVQYANAYGIDWLVITDHGNAQPEFRRSRAVWVSSVWKGAGQRVEVWGYGRFRLGAHF